MNSKAKIISIICKSIVGIFGVVGVALCLGLRGDSFMGGATTLLYFTIQSNIWIAFTCLAQAGCLIAELIIKKQVQPQWLRILRFVFTVSITLTGIVFCVMIAPFMGAGAWTLTNIFTHVIVPLFAVGDFVAFEWETTFTRKTPLWCTIPPLYYLIFATVGYFANWDFGGGRNYPYAFLNYGGSAGVFGFSTDTSDSLFLGSFYWIIILVAFVLGISYLYAFIACKMKGRMTLCSTTAE